MAQNANFGCIRRERKKERKKKLASIHINGVLRTALKKPIGVHDIDVFHRVHMAFAIQVTCFDLLMIWMRSISLIPN